MSFKLPVIGNDEMPLEQKAEQRTKQSPYVAAGSPTRCFLPSCGKVFEGSCYHADDGHYYCSEPCANEDVDPANVIVPLRKRN